MAQEKHVVIGHSMARRLEAFCTIPAYRNLGLTRSTVLFIGKDGRNNISSISDLQNYVIRHPGVFTNVATCVVEIGTNDLQQLHHLQPQALHNHVFHVASLIKDAGAARVVLMPIMFRQGIAALPRGVRDTRDHTVLLRAMEDFNAAAKEYNQLMLSRCAEEDVGISLHNTFGLRRRWGTHLVDGLHYNTVGLRKHWHNVRSAVIHAASQNNA